MLGERTDPMLLRVVGNVEGDLFLNRSNGNLDMNL